MPYTVRRVGFYMGTIKGKVAILSLGFVSFRMGPATNSFDPLKTYRSCTCILLPSRVDEQSIVCKGFYLPKEASDWCVNSICSLQIRGSHCAPSEKCSYLTYPQTLAQKVTTTTENI